MKRFWPALAVSIAAFITYSYAAWHHPIGSYGTETDFYHLFGPDALRISAGRFPENPFQGPGFPALVSVIAKFTGDVFVAGKWISVFAATATLIAVYLLFRDLFVSSTWGILIGVGAAALVTVSPEFPQFAISATTDALFLLLTVAFLLIFTRDSLSVRHRVVLCGVLGALAWITRYNGAFLMISAVIAIVLLDYFNLSWRDRVVSTLILIAAFCITASPWMYANYVNRGSPFYNANHLNMATEFYPELVEGKTNQDATRPLENVFRSFGDVIRYDPVRVAKHYPLNVWQSIEQSAYSTLMSPWVAWTALAGIVIALSRTRSKKVLFVLISALLYVLIIGLTHWETRYYFFLMVVCAGFAAYTIVAAFTSGYRAMQAAALVLFAIMWLSSFGMARKDLTGFLKSQPLEILAARDFLKQQGVTSGRIVARKPHLPFVAGLEWIFFPQVKSVDELGQWLETNPANYVVISSIETRRRKELASLREPDTAPSWLKLEWKNDDPLFILYRINQEPVGKMTGMGGEASK